MPFTSPALAPFVSPDIVISQVYGGAGCGTAGCSTYKNDYIELFNRSGSAVSVNGWSVQYASSAGTSWQVTNLPNVSIPAGGYLLVAEAFNNNGVNAIPTADATGGIAMSATVGKVALVSSTTALTGSCPTGIVDFIGYGTAANCNEGGNNSPAPSTANAVFRGGNGCTDTDNNGSDFTAAAAAPRNSATAAAPCGVVNAAIVPTCPGSLTTTFGTATSGNVSASDADGTVTSASISNITPSNPGTITLDSFTPAGTVGGIASAVLNVSNSTPANVYTVTITWSNNDSTPQTANCNITVTVTNPGITLIHDIQGNTETPNLAGQIVTIRGIVTGDFQGGSGVGLSGFFVQEEDSDADADANTSEGIFIFDGATPAVDVNVGDQVTVIGTVLNFGGTNGLTELSPVSSVIVNNAGNQLPAAVSVNLPVATSPATDLEKYEGMRVQFAQPLYVTDNDDLGAFGELSLAANGSLFIPTNSIDPNDNPASGNTITGNSNVAAVTAQQTLNNNSRLILDDGKGGSNPNPIPFIGAGTNATVRRGDSVVNLAGILSFGFSAYRIEPTGPVNFAANNPRQVTPDSVGASTLKVASFNVENYFVDPPDPTGRGPNTVAELTRKRDKVVAAIAGLNADVVGLIELEKGTQGTADAAATDIVNGLNALGNLGTWAVVATPSAVYTAPVGTDTEIKSGIIYRTDKVSLSGSSFTDTAAAVGAYSRAPIAQTFQQLSNGEKFTLVVNHFRSKSCPGSGGDADMGDGQACYNDRRRSQSQAVVSFVNTVIVPVDPDVLVVGDLNAYGQEDPIDVFRAAGFTDVLNTFVAAANQYSYTFSGETGRLDHVFATSSLASQLTGGTLWHINADEPVVFDYNTENKPDDRYAATPFASADHDPALVGLKLETACPTIVVSPSTVPNGTAGTAYGPVQFTQTGGASPITWSVPSNNLPNGLSLNPMTGELSGTPLIATGVNITVRATDTNNCFGEVIVTLQINCPAITISPSSGSPTSLTAGTVGQTYNQSFTAAPAGGNFTYSIPGPAIPPGLMFNAASGVLSGTPTAPGTYVFTVTATGFGTCQGTQSYSLTINCPTITISPAGPALTGGTVGTLYSQQLSASNTTGTVNYTLMSGSLPTGLTLSLGGLLSGTPTQSGTASFTVKATDANNCSATQSYTLAIACQTITVSAPGVTTGTAGSPFSVTFTQTGGIGATNFSTASSLPTGITLAANGTLSGTPTQTGSFPLVVTATDTNSCTGSASYTLTINCPTITVNPTTLPAGTTQTPYSQNLSASPAGATYSFNVTAGSLPTGLTLTTTGLLSGTPTAAGTFTFTVTATAFGTCTGSREYSVTISNGCQAFGFSPNSLPVGMKGLAYAATFSALNANGAVSYSVTAGALPAGLTLTSGGSLSGTPTAAGSFDFTVTAADTQGCTAARAYTLVIDSIAGSIGDPLVCLGPGGLVAVEATVTNSGAAPQAATFAAALPPQLLAVPGSCTVNTGTCTVVNASTVTWVGTLNAGQTVTIRYQTQAADSVTPGATLCINSSATVAGAGPFTVQACTQINCPPVGPGQTYAYGSAVSDQKAGSILVFNLYTSSASNPNQQNTRLSLTNTDLSRTAYVHLFFVDGASCSIADSVICLSPNQTATFMASDVDPGTSGYLVAVAMDRNGCPINFNHLIGDEYVKLSSGHAANLGAEAIAAIPGSGPLCDGNAPTAELRFDGVMYNALPRVLALSNLASPADGNSTLLVVNRIGGNLSTGASALSGVFGNLYDDAEQPFSFSFSPGTCQLRSILSNSFPRTTPRLETIIPAGRSGWLKFGMQTDGAILGAAINFNANAGATANAFNQGHNLHKLTLTTGASVTIPIFPPSC